MKFYVKVCEGNRIYGTSAMEPPDETFIEIRPPKQNEKMKVIDGKPVIVSKQAQRELTAVEKLRARVEHEFSVFDIAMAMINGTSGIQNRIVEIEADISRE